MRKRTFVYQAYVEPPKPKKIESARVNRKMALVAKPKPRPDPVDTSEYSTAINTAMLKFKLYHNADSVKLLDRIATQCGKLDDMIAKGNAKNVKRNVTMLLTMLTKVPHNKDQLKLAPSGSITHSRAMLRLAQATANNCIVRWLESDPDDGDPKNTRGNYLISFEMAAAQLHDAADYLHIANYVLLGQRQFASAITRKMDTSPREEIPLHVWNWIKK